MAFINIKDKPLPLGSVGRTGRQSDKRYIAIHEADCTLPAAGAYAHYRYFEGLCRAGVTPLSYHYLVDDSEVLRLIPDNEQSLHAGDGTGPNSANVRGISVLLCVNGDHGNTRRRAAQLVAHLMLTHSLDILSVQQHRDSGGKDCPHGLRRGGAWQRFLSDCEAEYERLKEHRRRCFESCACPWYKVQLCASKNHEEALRLACELRDLGYMAYVVTDLDYKALLGQEEGQS